METVHRATLGHGAKLLMVGSSSSTYRLAELIIKITRIDDDAAITQANAKAMAIEANVYSILGNHDRIANFIYISPLRDMILLQFYVNGNLKQYVARQMIEAVEIIHGKGVRHSDIRLDQ
jgi:hypothetical protein